MDVHRELGNGLGEIVYGDALEIEFSAKGINYLREKSFDILYKGINCP